MDTQKLRDTYSANQDKALANQRHQDQVGAIDNVSSTVVKTIGEFAKYLDGKVTKTEVINQLKTIGTPDVKYVVQAVNNLHATLMTHKNTDLSEITAVMRSILNETSQIPKTLPTEKEPIDYTDQLQSLGDAVKAIEQAVKDQNLVVEKQDAPTVNVTPPDLKPLHKDLTDVVTAVRQIVIPEFKYDNTEQVKLTTKTNKLLKDLLDKPASKGGGRFIVSPPYLDATGSPIAVTLNNGGVPTTKSNFAQKITVSGSNTYVAQAVIGSSQASAVWQVKCVNVTGGDTVITWANGDDKYDNVATDLTALSYI